MKRFVPRYLDPASRLGEILFGLIMVLTVTLSAGFVLDEGENGVRELLLAAIGCNFAWGFIDAVMYVMSCITVRSGKAPLVTAVQQPSGPAVALALIQDEIEPELRSLLDREEDDAFSRSVPRYISRARVGPTRITKEDLCGALACFWLVVLSCLPAALPFLLFSDPRLALRASNFLLLALLFLVGREWAQYVGMSQLGAGSVMVAIGLVLVGLAILLGG